MFYSTNGQSPKVRFKEALLKGQAPDKGLYMPGLIPKLSTETINSFAGMSYPEIASEIIKNLLPGEFPEKELLRIVSEAYDFDVPLENVYNRNYIMRLDQGPTASFKDFAARVMGRFMQYYLDQDRKEMLILTATSGDTGSAIANAFYGLENIQVVILYPLKEVTDRQRKQMTTLHQNITVLALDGKFDDCQAMVKKAFSDPELSQLPLSSANSINIGRLIPQSVYYFYAYSRLSKENEKIIFSVPSGNFGNLMGGLLAREMGLPVEKFVVATNENDEVPVFFEEGKYQIIEPSRNCISSAMNVGHPSNMARVFALYGGFMNEKGEIIRMANMDLLRQDMFAVSIPDYETKDTIRQTYLKHKVLLEPHGAVGWAGLKHFFTQSPQYDNPGQLTVCLETAHPAKFPQEIIDILDIDPQLPDSMKGIEEKKELFYELSTEYNDFKNFLLNHFKNNI